MTYEILFVNFLGIKSVVWTPLLFWKREKRFGERYFGEVIVHFGEKNLFDDHYGILLMKELEGNLGI